MGRILVVEDDQSIGDFIAFGLRERRHVVVQVASLAEAEACMDADAYDLCIFDRKLPDGDSLAIVASRRSRGFETPVLVLSAVGQTDERIAGLEAGADDYMAKPFSVAELAARVRALLRRRPVIEPKFYSIGNLLVLTDDARIEVGGAAASVTTNEWRFLSALAEHPGRVHSREAIMARAGIAEDASDVAVDHLVSRLRRKLREAGATVHIRTVRGVGFALDVDPPPRTLPDAGH